MVMGACPGQIPISCVPLTLMVTATVVRACRYKIFNVLMSENIKKPFMFVKRFVLAKNQKRHLD